MGSYTSREDYEVVEFLETDTASEYKLMVQVTRKINLINSLKYHFENIDRNSVYYKNMIGTVYCETEDGITRMYEMRSNFFFSCIKVEIFKNNIEYLF